MSPELTRPRMDPAVLDYYARTPEEARLELGPGQLEHARTRELIARHLPLAPATIIDIGGAAGV